MLTDSFRYYFGCTKNTGPKGDRFRTAVIHITTSVPVYVGRNDTANGRGGRSLFRLDNLQRRSCVLFKTLSEVRAISKSSRTKQILQIKRKFSSEGSSNLINQTYLRFELVDVFDNIDNRVNYSSYMRCKGCFHNRPRWARNSSSVSEVFLERLLTMVPQYLLRQSRRHLKRRPRKWVFVVEH
jgi:hypothetical protein